MNLIISKYMRVFKTSTILFIGVVLLLVLLFSCRSQTKKAEGSELIYNTTEYDFGTIRELDGVVSYTFNFENRGKDAVVIERVRVDCDCSTSDYTRTPILAGESGKITISYNPEDRAGVFVRDIEVITMGGERRDVLRIKGEVEGRVRTVDEDYPYYSIGSQLRMSTISLYRSYVEQGEAVSFVVRYANATDREVELGFVTEPKSDYLWVDFEKRLEIGGRAEATVSIYVPVGSDDYGSMNIQIYPVVDGVREKQPITLETVVVDGDGRASLVIEPEYHNFGVVKRGAKLEQKFVLENRGEQELIIRAVEVGKRSWTTLERGMTIGKGESVDVKFGMTVEGDQGLITEKIKIVVNDAMRPIREVRLMAEIR